MYELYLAIQAIRARN
uniref:Uncharacterized protein n=1 Tax=Arundo donax TaxID=35708 RepID=A0A0A9HQZ2_ARUDO